MTGRLRAAIRDGWRVNLPLWLLPAVLAAYALSPGPGRALVYLAVDLTCVAGILLAQRGRSRAQSAMWLVVGLAMTISTAVSYTHLTLPTNREV